MYKFCCVPYVYFFDQTPWLLFFSACFVWLLFEGGDYCFGKLQISQLNKVQTGDTAMVMLLHS